MNTTIQLDEAIAKVKERYREAETVYDDPPAEDIHEKEAQRRDLLAPIFALNREIRTLEHVRDEKAAASVVVEAATPEEVKAIEDALKVLDAVIRRTQQFQAILALIGAAADAASTLSAASRKSTPAPSATVAEFAARFATAPDARRRAAPRYVCWELHQEDITDRVLQALDDTSVTAAATNAGATTSARRIVVSCTAGHVNLFNVAVPR